MARQKTYPKEKKSSRKKKKNSSYKVNDFHYRFDGHYKQSKPEISNTFFQIPDCTPQDVHDIAINVFGKTYYISVCDM